MLMYHPAQDTNHCVYRLLLLLDSMQNDTVSVDTYRLIDFYILFPYLLKYIKPLPAPLSKYRSKFKNIPVPFEALKNTRRILFELENLQSASIQNLLAKNILDKESFDSGLLKRTDVQLPEVFVTELNNSVLAKEEWFKAIVNGFPEVEFEGKSGLKARTGLMEYRYDLEK